MTVHYGTLRSALTMFQETADRELQRLEDAQLHNEVNEAAKHAALAVIRIDQIEAADQQQQGR
jgi:hypothetical protein